MFNVHCTALLQFASRVVTYLGLRLKGCICITRAHNKLGLSRRPTRALNPHSSQALKSSLEAQNITSYIL